MDKTCRNCNHVLPWSAGMGTCHAPIPEYVADIDSIPSNRVALDGQGADCECWSPLEEG